MKKVSCVMPTYNRGWKSKHLVEEAVESFLRQTHDDKELIIVNDAPTQVMQFEHPQVLVVNSPRRYHTLGEKLNAGFGLASGDFLCRFDDDDISLPWRLSLSAERLEQGLAYWSSKELYFRNGNTMRISRQGAPSKSMWTREVFDAVGGFPHMGSGQDQIFQLLCKKNDPSKWVYDSLKHDEVFYIYRWGTGSLHLSGYGKGEEGYKLIGERKVEGGDFILIPHWQHDYVALAKEVEFTASK